MRRSDSQNQPHRLHSVLSVPSLYGHRLSPAYAWAYSSSAALRTMEM